jgi:hypothetical protein
MYRYAVFTAAALLSAVTSVYANPPASNATAKAGDPRDQIVCRRFVRTGSLVDGYRLCKTNREWQRDRAEIQRQEMSDSCRNRGTGGACPGT